MKSEHINLMIAIAVFIGMLILIVVAWYNNSKNYPTHKYTTDQLEYHGIETIHDSKRNATCYKSHDGLSCIKD